MSDYKLAIKIAGELDGSLTSAVTSAQAMLDGLNKGGKGGASTIGGKILGGIAKGAAALGKASAASLGMVGSAAIAASAAATKTGMDFESAMSDLAGTAGITKASEEYQAMESAAREVGATTNKTATEAAAALKYMSLAGWDTNDSIQALDDMVKLSSASGTDLARTSDLVTDSMGALNLGMDDYAGYMDLVARADSAANYTSEQFMETMIGAGGAARVLGVNLNDLGTAAGILANNGTKGAEAGTALNSMFARMSGNSKAKDTMADLGIELYDAQGQFLGLENVLGQVNTALDGFGDDAAGRNQAMKDLFGTNYMSEAKYLLDSIGEGGTWDSLSQNLQNAQDGVDEFGNSFDTLDERYGTATDNLKGDLDILTSAGQDFGIEIYDAIVGGEGAGLRGAVQGVTQMMGELKEAFKVDGLEGLANQIGTEVGNIASNIQSNGGAAIDAAFAFADQLVESIGSKDNSDKIGGAAATIITSIGENFLTYTGDFAVAAGNLITGFAEGLVAEDTADKWVTAGTAMIDSIGNWFKDNGDRFGTAGGNLISSLAIGIAAHSGEIISGGLEIAQGLGQGLIKGAVILVSNLPSIIGQLAMGLLEGVDQLFQVGVTLALALVDGLKSIGGQISDWYDSLWDMSKFDMSSDSLEYLSAHVDEVNAAVQEGIDNGGYFEGFAEGLSPKSLEYLQLMADGTISLADAQSQLDNYNSATGNQIGGTNFDYNDMEPAINAYKQVAQESAAAAEAASTANDEMTQSAQDSTTGISAETQAMVDNIKAGAEGMSEVGDTMNQQFEAVKTEAQSTSAAATEALSNQITDAMTTLNPEALSTVLQSIDGGTIDTLTTSFSTAMTTIQTSASSAASAVQSSMTAATTAVTMGMTAMNMAVTMGMALMVAAITAGGVAAVASAQSTASSIVSTFASINLYGIGVSIMQGLTAGIQAAGAAAIAAAQSIAAQIASIMAGALAIHSPSRVMYDIGENVGLGLEGGITDSGAGVRSAAQGLAGNVLAGTNDSMSGVLRTFNAPQQGTSPAQRQESAGGDGSIVFSPQITIQGNATESDVRRALTWSMEEFERMYDRLQQNRRRTAYA